MQKHEISLCLTYDFGILPALAIILDMIHLKDFPSRKILAKKNSKYLALHLDSPPSGQNVLKILFFDFDLLTLGNLYF